MNEQIQKAIDIAVEKRLSESLSVFNLPLIAKYKLLCFNGAADGVTLLNPNFNINDIIGKVIIIKSIQICTYYVNDSIDFQFFDGATTTTETIPATFRVQRIIDLYDTAALGNNGFKLSINGQVWDAISTNRSEGNLIPDVKLDNIYYKYPEKVQTVSITYRTLIAQTLATPGTTITPNVKVFVECYLI